MATHVEKTQILAMRYLYQQIQGKIVTLDNLLLQEKEYLDKCHSENFKSQ